MNCQLHESIYDCFTKHDNNKISYFQLFRRSPMGNSNFVLKNKLAVFLFFIYCGLGHFNQT